MKKEALVNALEKKVEQHLQEAVETFQNMPVPLLLTPAANDGWSIAQCLEHLNSYGRYYLTQIEQSLRKKTGDVTKEYVYGNRLGNYFTRLMDPQSSRTKFKAFKKHRPPSSLDAHAVVAEFIEQQEQLIHSLKQLKNVDPDAIRIPISICPWIKLKLGDVLQFLIAHNERHIQQAKRNLL